MSLHPGNPGPNRLGVWVTGLLFVTCLFIDWRVAQFMPGKVRTYLTPCATLLWPLLLGAEGVFGRGRRRAVQEQRAMDLFFLCAIWFVVAIVCELLFHSGAYGVPLSDQSGAYLSFAQVIAWSWAGYHVVQSRKDALWLLKRFAAGMAVLCALSWILLLTGHGDVARYAADGSLKDSADVAADAVIRAPNWGVQGFLLFGYCWFLSSTLLSSRWFSWPFLGLLACCELWAQMTKMTIFGIFFGTVFITLLVVIRVPKNRRNISRLIIVPAALSLSTIGVLIATSEAGTDRIEKVSDYIAQRYFHIPSLNLKGATVANLVISGSTGRMDYIWPQAIKRFESSPLFGCGFNQNFRAGGLDVQYLPIHNAYLDLLVGVGLFGSLPVLLALLLWSRIVWKAIRLPANILVLVPSIGYAVCFFCVNMGDMLRYFYTPIMFFGLMLGIAVKVSLLPLAPRSGVGRRWRGRLNGFG